MSKWVGLLPVVLGLSAALGAPGCHRGEGSGSSSSASASTASSDAVATASPAGDPSAAVPIDPGAWDACKAMRAEAEKQPALPGAPAVAEKAIQFARVRSRSLLWKEAPAMPEPVKKLLSGKPSSIRLFRQMKDLVNKKAEKEVKRKQVLSEDGYLFADDPVLALALIEQVSLLKLFDERTLYLQRGVDIYEIDRAPETKLDKERYVYKDGPFDGEKVDFLFGDRVATSRAELESKPSRVVDLSDLMTRSEFDRIRPVKLTEKALVADVRYGADTWVPALFDVQGSKLELKCEALTAELAKAKAKFVEERKPLRQAMKRVRAVVRKMVRERIPFDAGTGKKNGYLRKAWLRAYLAGWRAYTYEEDKHDVYSFRGEPMPPQVCIDFQTDVWERAGGTWYQAAKMDPFAPSPKRTLGPVDFDSLKIDNRRSVADFVEGAKKHPDLFDVWEVPQSEKIPFRKRDEFYQYLHDKQDMFRPGDMITVFGMKNGHPHYHSLMVLEQDPVTGVITLVAGNAVFPREQSLEGILQISPKRSLKQRVRVLEPWLKAVAANDDPI